MGSGHCSWTNRLPFDCLVLGPKHDCFFSNIIISDVSLFPSSILPEQERVCFSPSRIPKISLGTQCSRNFINICALNGRVDDYVKAAEFMIPTPKNVAHETRHGLGLTAHGKTSQPGERGLPLPRHLAVEAG